MVITGDADISLQAVGRVCVCVCVCVCVIYLLSSAKVEWSQCFFICAEGKLYLWKNNSRVLLVKWFHPHHFEYNQHVFTPYVSETAALLSDPLLTPLVSVLHFQLRVIYTRKDKFKQITLKILLVSSCSPQWQRGTMSSGSLGTYRTITYSNLILRDIFRRNDDAGVLIMLFFKCRWPLWVTF